MTDGHQWRQLLAQAQERPSEVTSEEESDDEWVPAGKSYSDWGKQITNDWKAQRDAFAKRHDLDPEQASAATEAVKARGEQLAAYLEEESEGIADYRFELFRLQQWEASPLAGEVPFQDTRIAVKSADVSGRPGVWISQVGIFDDDLVRDLNGLLTEQQKGRSGGAFGLPSMMTLISKTVTYWVLGVGVLLILGLLTRCASIAGAVFLLSVVATQPPWVAGAEPVYFQWVEMVACLVLATTPVGRWCGLDFFLHALFRKRGDNPGGTT